MISIPPLYGGKNIVEACPSFIRIKNVLGHNSWECFLIFYAVFLAFAEA